MYLNWCT